MKERVAVLTRKGQVTIPAEIRHALGLQRGDKIAFFIEDDQVRLAFSGSVVARTAGALRSRRSALPPDRLRRAAERAIADAAAERS